MQALRARPPRPACAFRSAFGFGFGSTFGSAVGLALTLSACGPRVPDSIEIGVAEPLSGPSAARGQDLLNGALLAAEELNAAGFSIAGKPVRITIVAKDDKADKETAKKVAQELVDQKVVAVIGHLSSDITEVAIPIYKAGNVPEFFTSSATQLAALGAGNVFRLVANDELQGQAMAGYPIDHLKANTFALIYEETSFGTPLAKDVTTSLAKAKKQLGLSQPVDNKATDFSAVVAKLKAAPPDALVAVLRDNQLLPLFSQLAAAGLAEVPVVIPGSAKTQKLAQGPNNMKAVFVTSSTIDASEFPNSEFVAHFRNKFHADPVWAAHYAYDAVYVMTDAMRRNDSVEPAALRTRLAKIDAIAPATVTMRFDNSGEQRYGAISVYQRRDGKWDPLMRSDHW